eukprot:SAG11_NODE_2103_length_3819_cov_2.904032_2_plen_858_part_01
MRFNCACVAYCFGDRCVCPQRKKEGPQRRWIRECRKAVGDATKPYINDDGAGWDLYTLTSIMEAHLRHVFVAPGHVHCTAEAEAKELLVGLQAASEHRTRRGHQQQPTEDEAVDSLAQMASALAHCGVSAADVEELQRDASRLVEQARSGGGGAVTTRRLTREQYERLTVCRAFRVFDEKLRRNAGWFEYKKGTINFGQRVASAWDEPRRRRVQDVAVKQHFGTICAARHSLFHNAAAAAEPAAVLGAMGAVLHALRGIDDPAAALSELTSPQTCAEGWDFAEQLAAGAAHAGLDGCVPVAVRLHVSGRRMAIPKTASRMLTGRSAQIEEVVAAAVGQGARVLVHGVPGVGKDEVAAAAVRCEAIERHPDLQMQGWLLGSTDGGLRRQLVEFFARRQPAVVRGCEEDQPAALARIRAWLADHPTRWLFVVEDATWECAALWECFPPRAGRLIATSQSPLHEPAKDAAAGVAQVPWAANATAIQLFPLATEDSVDLWRRSNLFAQKEDPADKANPPPEDRAWWEAELQRRCAATGGAVPYQPAPKKEKGSATKQRHRDLRAALLAHAQLGQPELAQFFENELGNLPLSVSLTAHMFRADRTLQTVGDLIGAFGAVELDTVDDELGHNKEVPGSHYYGLVRSVIFAVRRLAASAGPEEGRRLALALLVTLALLPPTGAPASLFRQTEWTLREEEEEEGQEQQEKEQEEQQEEQQEQQEQEWEDEAEIELRPEPAPESELGAQLLFAQLYRADGGGFDDAAELLQTFGLLQPAADGESVRRLLLRLGLVLLCLPPAVLPVPLPWLGSEQSLVRLRLVADHSPPPPPPPPGGSNAPARAALRARAHYLARRRRGGRRRRAAS